VRITARTRREKEKKIGGTRGESDERIVKFAKIQEREFNE
jgi:hypothetical protein